MASGDGYEVRKRLYFGFGSNLWRDQMHRRCPQSTFLGVGRLRGWCWIINERGYANAVELKQDSDTVDGLKGEVWGLIYSLNPTDETALDKNEGVPYAYTKEIHKVDFWDIHTSNHDNGAPASVDLLVSKSMVKDMLVYVDRIRTVAGVPREEYVHRINQGIKDALACGVPRSYIDQVMRAFISEPPLDASSDSVRQKAEDQAKGFKDESGVIPD